MSNIKSTGQMENCFQLIIFIFIIFLDSERKVRYVFLIEMTQFTAVFVLWLEWHFTCYCPFTYWCHWVHLVYGNNINVSNDILV